MEYLDDFCAITEHRLGQFHKTRVSIWSFVQKNKWFNGKIVIIVLDESDISEIEMLQLDQIYNRFEILKIEQNVINKIKKKINKKNLEHNKTLDFSFMYALKIKSKGNLYFSSTVIFNRDVTSFLQDESANFAYKSGNMPIGSGEDVNTSIFYISGEMCSDRLFDSAITFFLNHSNIFSSDSKSQIIISALKDLKIPINMLNLVNVVDSSSFPESKYREFLRYNKAICVINMNTIDLNDYRFIRMNLYWQNLNKQSLDYRPSKTIIKKIPKEKSISHLKLGKDLRKIDHSDKGYHSKFCVMITTCQRSLGVHKLTKMLKEIDPNCRIVVVDDATDSKVETRYMDDYIRLDKNNGKEGWWKTINLLWSKALEKNHKYYIMIPDDALPKRNFFNEAERLWNSINDTNKIAMHLANNNRDRNWTNFKRQDFSSELYLTQTTEFSFICDGTFIQYIIPPVPKSEWSKNPLKSSGVGPRLNRYWIKSGKNIYGVKSSLIYQNYLCTESIMNPIERKLNPWIFK